MLSDAASQVWPPFVLVAGLLLVGSVVERDGLFAWAGSLLGRLARNGFVLFTGGVVLIAVLYGCLLLSNAASLLLPGSNLTNLIVLGHLHLEGHELLQRMAAPFAASVVVTASVVALRYRHHLQLSVDSCNRADRPTMGLGLLALTATLGLVLALPNPAIPVLAVGLTVVAIESMRRRVHVQEVRRTIGAPTLVALFTAAVALGVLGREWDGPTRLLDGLGTWATAYVAAVASVLVNNLPAAALLSAQRSDHPVALLIGLNLGPNLFVTGSLSWLLWLRAARATGAKPSLRQASLLGCVAAPLAIAAALAAAH
jgi:arsenical pump membrane protein